MEIRLKQGEKTFIGYVNKHGQAYTFTLRSPSITYTMLLERWDEKKNILYFSYNQVRYKLRLLSVQEVIYGIMRSTNSSYPLSYLVHKITFAELSSKKTASPIQTLMLHAPLSGRVVSLLYKEGERVAQGKPLLAIESMKMENEIRSPQDGVIKTIFINVGDVVETNQPLVVFKESLDEGKDEKEQIKNR